MTPDGAAAANIAILALVISVLAAGFSGWQAVTAHLARTAPTRARWSFDFDSAQSRGWRIYNSGGSMATDVRVTITLPHAPEPNFERTFEAIGAVPPGQYAVLSGTDKLADPRTVYTASATQPGVFDDAKREDPGSFALVGQYAAVAWRDFKGRPQDTRVPLW